MTPLRLRLLLRDGAASVAFASMALSGQLPTWVTLGFAVGAGCALLGLRLRGTVVVNLILLAGMLFLFGRALRGRMDLVVAASTFAALLTVLRMLAPPSKAGDGHVHLVALLMVTGGAALSADPTFMVCLVAFTLLASFSLALGILESTAEESGEDPPVRQVMPRLWAGGAATLVLGAFFFVLFPRLSWNMAARQGPQSFAASTIGFTGEVQLGGGGGALKTNPRPAFRARLSPDPGRFRLDAYWHGRSLDTFNGVGWTARHRREAPQPRVELQPPRAGAVHQDIELLAAYGSRTLVALEAPATFDSVVPKRAGDDARPRLIRIVDEQVRLPSSFTLVSYRATSQPGAASELVDEDLERYRALPEKLDPRVMALATTLLRGETDPAAAAERVVRYLKSELTYSLETPPAGTDPLVDFLFERRQGHCEHFATALAVLLRARGFATRVVTGFYGGERVDDAYVVRAADAHAWVQVWIPGRGFVTYDATPEGFRAGQPSVALEWLARQYETLERFWRTQVVDYSLADQERFADQAVDTLRRPQPEPASSDVRSRPPLWVAAIVLGALGLAWRWYGRRGATAADRTARLGERIARRLRRAQPPIEAGESLEEYLARLVRTGDPLAVALQRVVRRYLEARFGPRPLEPGETELLVRLVHAALKRQPPPPPQARPRL